MKLHDAVLISTEASDYPDKTSATPLVGAFYRHKEVQFRLKLPENAVGLYTERPLYPGAVCISASPFILVSLDASVRWVGLDVANYEPVAWVRQSVVDACNERLTK